MRGIAAVLWAVGVCSASSGLAMDLITKDSQQDQTSQNSPSLQASSGTAQQSFVFGD